MVTKHAVQRLRPLLAAAILTVAGIGVCRGEGPRWSEEYERAVGDRTAAQVDTAYDRVDDAEALAKLQNMADVLGAHTPRPGVKYDVRLVKEKQAGPEPEVNAFSLPGGIIYVTEGLLNSVSSDDELAGVMAHEITHNVNYDALVQGERAGNIVKGEIAAVVAAILLGGVDNDTWVKVMQMGMLTRQGILGGYSIEMEKRADRGAVAAMLGSPWDPVGLLTFMERLAAQERRNPPGPLGVYQTHPLSTERVNYLLEALDQAGVRINRRKTGRWERPVVEAQEINGKQAFAVLFMGQQIFACDTPAEGFATAQERAEAVNGRLTEALAAGAQAFSFAISGVGQPPALLASGSPIFTVDPADAALLGKPAEEVARDSYVAIRRALTLEGWDRRYRY